MVGVATGLDFGAIMMVAQGQGADLELLSETLPGFEAAVLAGLNGEMDNGD